MHPLIRGCPFSESADAGSVGHVGDAASVAVQGHDPRLTHAPFTGRVDEATLWPGKPAQSREMISISNSSEMFTLTLIFMMIAPAFIQPVVEEVFHVRLGWRSFMVFALGCLAWPMFVAPAAAAMCGAGVTANRPMGQSSR